MPMGAYIQVGVCTDISLSKAALARAHLTKEEAAGKLAREFLDLTLFVEHEDADEIRWTLPRDFVEEELAPFLHAQHGLFGHCASKDSGAILDRIAKAERCDRVISLAEERSTRERQAGTLREILPVGLARERLRLRASILVYLVEGKVMMESYTRLFAYMEWLIHEQKGRFPIAAAVKVLLA